MINFQRVAVDSVWITRAAVGAEYHAVEANVVSQSLKAVD